MPKLPYMQFYVSDWTSDCQLAMCSLSTRGCWLELLCGMHSLDHCGVITGTAEQLARVCRCSVVEFVQAVDELRSYRIGEITERNGVYTVVNRRMRREHEASEGAKTRQKRFQDAKKTRNKREINGGESESESEPENEERERGGAEESRIRQEAEKIRELHPRKLNLYDDVSAIVEAIQREADKPGETVETVVSRLNAAVQSYADAVANWPANKKRFIAPCRKWFAEGRYLEDPASWIQNDRSSSGGFNAADPSTWR